MFNNFFFLNRAVYEIRWKKCTAGQVTDDSMGHARCMLSTEATVTHL